MTQLDELEKKIDNLISLKNSSTNNTIPQKKVLNSPGLFGSMFSRNSDDQQSRLISQGSSNSSTGGKTVNIRKTKGLRKTKRLKKKTTRIKRR